MSFLKKLFNRFEKTDHERLNERSITTLFRQLFSNHFPTVPEEEWIIKKIPEKKKEKIITDFKVNCAFFMTDDRDRTAGVLLISREEIESLEGIEKEIPGA